MRHRLMPLFKAAAVVAIFLTLGNAMQVAFSDDDAHQVSPNTAAVNKPQEGPSVAKADSVVSDTLNNIRYSHLYQPSQSKTISMLSPIK